MTKFEPSEELLEAFNMLEHEQKLAQKNQKIEKLREAYIQNASDEQLAEILYMSYMFSRVPLEHSGPWDLVSLEPVRRFDTIVNGLPDDRYGYVSGPDHITKLFARQYQLAQAEAAGRVTNARKALKLLKKWKPARAARN